MENRDQKYLIEKSNWDYLVILDACRFDTFEKNYKEYFDGELKKVRSRGSSTGEWLYKTFNEQYNITYFSTNPYINNLGLSIKKLSPSYTFDWNAMDHFRTIHNTTIKC